MRLPSAEKAILAVESRWPEWDRPYIIHGLVLESRQRASEARLKLKAALALGSRDPAARCALARLDSAAMGPECACIAGLREVLVGNCGR